MQLTSHLHDSTCEYFQDPIDGKKNICYAMYGKIKSVKYDKAPVSQRSL